MLTDQQTNNLHRLIQHYAETGKVNNWSWEECACGIAARLGIISSFDNVHMLSEALGVNHIEASVITWGPPGGLWISLLPADRCALVIELFEGVLLGEKAHWNTAHDRLMERASDQDRKDDPLPN